MEPEPKFTSEPETAEPKTEPTPPVTEPILSQTPTALASSPEQGPKPKNKLTVPLIIVSILAAAGLGFGVYSFLNPKIEVRTETVTTEGADSTEHAETTTFANPILKSAEENYKLGFQFKTEAVSMAEGSKIVSILVSDGTIDSCRILLYDNGYYNKDIGDCQISGLPGKIHNIAHAGNTQMMWPYVAFLLEDGSVYYVETEKLLTGGNVSIEGKFNIEKPVSSIINAAVGPASPEVAVGSYNTTVFVHPDGTYTQFAKSMLP